ncbi:protein of unknown function DUF952 [Rhodomicrobium vannielii ATCC 17100]|uniref:Dihydroorotate dehydrogenase n=1 Tax=Rhodomicrobium vannielii (strain ATCC 17100 / DSM 162 / LMG 4299 / NCIMB 10020 / ATH 3.1.1) TaxID=648757 RepID=E3I3N8_RHOVT|nr:DUF952 domain-containing protein [Rhodomicrobium vannielii]ADP70385.1 protein of unknown function DUF952 [Rhodomicrobium vannielii ATCC 17100]
MTDRPRIIYKLVTRGEWEAVRSGGIFAGSDVDRRDGFIHFSTAAQVAETARRHFTGVPNLVLVALDADMLAALPSLVLDTASARNAAETGQLRFEASRGGESFPHLYAPLPFAAVIGETDVALGPDGAPLVPKDLAS